MKIRVTTDKYDYQGLYLGQEYEAARQLDQYVVVTMGKVWTLDEEECEWVSPVRTAKEECRSSYCEGVYPAPNEKLMDAVNTDLKKEECRSSYCECEEGKCSSGKVDRRVDKTEKKESVLDIQHGGSHYKDKGIQPIEYITANNLGFCEGNIVKYASRHQDKNGAEDIRKVIHYAQFILKFQYNEDI